MSASTSTSTSALPTRRQSLRQLPVGTAGPQPNWALDLFRQLPRAVGTAGPQLPASDLSGHGWTSTALSAVGTAGPQPDQVPELQWAPLDPNRQVPSAVGTAGPQPGPDLQSSEGTAGPQPGTFRAQWAPLDLNGQIECQKIWQIERQIEFQKEC